LNVAAKLRDPKLVVGDCEIAEGAWKPKMLIRVGPAISKWVGQRPNLRQVG